MAIDRFGPPSNQELLFLIGVEVKVDNLFFTHESAFVFHVRDVDLDEVAPENRCELTSVERIELDLAQLALQVDRKQALLGLVISPV